MNSDDSLINGLKDIAVIKTDIHYIKEMLEEIKGSFKTCRGNSTDWRKEHIKQHDKERGSILGIAVVIATAIGSFVSFIISK